MRIPVFVSMPTDLSDAQAASRKIVEKLLKEHGLEPRTLGQSDYPDEYPLKEVYAIGRHCSGGVILGFEQVRVTAGIAKPGTAKERKIKAPYAVPTPWNHLEAGILFGLGLPLLIFREPQVTGGIFDAGVSDVFVQLMPDVAQGGNRVGLKEVVLKWQARVRQHYYRDVR
ncbi:hypothetical protein WEI85_16040 [Actinomycetes bacterium KLBMP 9797]